MGNILEEAAKSLEMDTQNLFREICVLENVNARRFDALWDAYKWELFIPDFVERYCLRAVLGTTGILNEGAD